MAGKTRIGGTIYDIAGGKTRIGGTIYDIAAGKTRINSTIYDIAFGPDPLQIYSAGDTALRNGASLAAYDSADVFFYADGINMRSKYGSSPVHFSCSLPTGVMSGYKKIFVTISHTDIGAPDDARVGWGNGEYGYNLAYYTPSIYAAHGTTKYQELNFAGATADQTFVLDIKEVAGAEDIQFGVYFSGSGTDSSRDKTKAIIKDIHLE